MGARQVEIIERGIESANLQITALEDSPKLCANFDSQNSVGDDVWIQVFAGTVNTMYPFSDEPLQRVRSIGVKVPAGVELIEWEANGFATFGVEGVAARDQAAFVDLLFVRLLACVEGVYEIVTTIEDLE
jgi:hypothetical protein